MEMEILNVNACNCENTSKRNVKAAKKFAKL